MVEWHHFFNGHKFKQAPGDNERQGSLVCCNPWGRKELDTIQQLKSTTTTTTTTNVFSASHICASSWFGCLCMVNFPAFLHAWYFLIRCQTLYFIMLGAPYFYILINLLLFSRDCLVTFRKIGSFRFCFLSFLGRTGLMVTLWVIIPTPKARSPLYSVTCRQEQILLLCQERYPK